MRGRSTVLACLPGWGGVLGVILCLATAARGEPSPDTRRQVRFETADDVNLRGSFYPGKGQSPPCALLLHDLGEEHSRSDWDGLARELQALGLAVLTFDFRGHGESIFVDRGFWDVPLNRQMVRGFRAGQPPDRISRRDFQSAYYPVLANDVAAARQYLDGRNDTGDCNSARLFVLGAGEGATLGALWLTSECSRFRALDTLLPRLGDVPESRRIAAGVWLNIAPTLGRRRVPLTTWLRQAGRKERVPMAFLYGDEDTEGAALARRCLDQLETRGEGRKFTAAQAVRGSVQAGTDLLGPSHPTAGLVCNYVKNLLAETPEPEWRLREVEEEAYWWVFPGTKPELAKRKGEGALRLLPLRALGLP